MKRFFLILAFLLITGLPALAHEVRPAYLMLEEQVDGTFSTLWKVPVLSGAMPAIELVLPAECQRKSEPFAEMRDGAYVRTWSVACGADGLEGKQITIKGLSATLIDVIVRIYWHDGQGTQLLLTPDQTQGVVGTRKKQSRSFQFLPMGIKHILYGFDHLAFLLCLLLFMRKAVPLIKTITAFTLAHSISLFLVAFGFLMVPATPVEFMVALSIVLLAAEILGKKEASVSQGWRITFAFGLLHGLGYAGALQRIGLPEGDVISALLFFNLGVELGQLGFVILVLIHLRILERIWTGSRPYIERYTAHAVGFVGVFWMIERLLRIVNIS